MHTAGRFDDVGEGRPLGDEAAGAGLERLDEELLVLPVDQNDRPTPGQFAQQSSDSANAVAVSKVGIDQCDVGPGAPGDRSRGDPIVALADDLQPRPAFERDTNCLTKERLLRRRICAKHMPHDPKGENVEDGAYRADTEHEG